MKDLNEAQAELDAKQAELDEVQAQYEKAVREKQVCFRSFSSVGECKVLNCHYL